MKRTKDGFQGQIGSNITRSREEIEENILRLLYEWWTQDRALDKDAVCRALGLTRRKLAYYVRSMTEHGYVKGTSSENEMALTDFGKEQGHECRDRHQNITHFIQLICDVDEETATENACRMEHVVGDEVIDGIFNFLKSGETYDHEIRNMNFNTMYEEGNYCFRMTLYESDHRYPRVLAREFGQFQDEIAVEVGQSGSRVCLRAVDSEPDFFLWYKREKVWEKCSRSGNIFQIPAEIFSVTKSRMIPVTEGMAMLGITKQDREPEVGECRELNIHMW